MLHSGTVRWKGPRKKPPAPDLTPGPGLEITPIPDLAPRIKLQNPSSPWAQNPTNLWGLWPWNLTNPWTFPRIIPQKLTNPKSLWRAPSPPPHPKKPSISFYSDFVVIPWLPVARVPFHLSRNAYWHSPAIPALRDLARNTTSSRLGHRGKPVSTVKTKKQLKQSWRRKKRRKRNKMRRNINCCCFG